MRGVALALWGLGALAGLYLRKATSPALEASYRLSADRWRQGQAPYEVLQAPVDPVGLWLFRTGSEYGEAYLLLSRVVGGLLLVGFLLWKPLREAPPTLWQGVLIGLVGGLYQILPYPTPLQTGEAAYAIALWLGESTRRPFLWGVLLSLLIFWQPAALWAILFWFYRRWENNEGRAVLYHLLGVFWATLALLTLIKTFWGVSALKAYLRHYWIGVWSIGSGDGLLWLLNGLSTGALVLFSGEVGRLPYRERTLFRRILWAALSSLGWGGRAFPGMALFAVHVRPLSLRLMQVLLGLCYLSYAAYLLVKRPAPDTCIALAAESCFWGMPTCYLAPQGPYGCDLTNPYAWQGTAPSLEELYQKLRHPEWIYDAGGYMGRLHYYMPWRLAPYKAVDTTLPGFIRLYRREARDSLPWIRARP